MTISQRAFASLTLILVASILPEMLSGNTPTLALFSPQIFLFVIFGYGLPIVLIREFAVRQSIGFAGLFLLGLGYGIINEALLAKTVFRSTGVPVDVYDGYGFAFGIQWAWTAFILPWHAMASTIIPIAFAHCAVPKAAQQPWLSVRISLGLAFVLCGLISFFYLFEDSTTLPRTVPMLLALWAVIAVLVAVAWRLARSQHPASTPLSKWKLVALGYSGIIPFLSLPIMANFRVPLIIYFAIVLLWIALYRFLSLRFAHVDHPAFGWFGLGWYLHVGTFSWISVAAQYPYKIATDLVAFAALWWILQRRAGLNS